MSPSISTAKNPNPKPHPITRRTLLLTAAGAFAATGTGTLWWNSTPHYPTEEHHRIADAIADATDTGPRLLRLITCGGSDGQGHYTTNIVITCTPA